MTLHPEPDIRADVTHELRGALHTIVGHASLLDGRIDDERMQRSVSSIVGSARRASAILEAARLLDDRGPTRDEETDLADALARAVEPHRPVFASRRVAVELGGETAHGAWVRCDRATVDVVLDLVLCWAVRRAEPDATVRFAVRGPDGRATSPSTVALRMHVGGGDRKADSGLRLVERLLHDVGGELRPGAPPAPPAPLELRWPAAALRERTPAAGPGTTDVGEASPAHVLVVDDDEHSRAFVEFAVRSAGCAVHTAGDLAAARAVFAEHDIDVVIADHHLGPDRGIDLLHEIRERGRRCRALLLTGDVDPRLDADVRALGAEVLRKPVDLDVLVEIATAARTPVDRG
jgi:CheY-like chemotaxis protein